MVKLLAGTSNPHKVEEITALLAGLPLRVMDASALSPFPEVEENGATFEENAAIKAAAFAWAAADLPPATRPRWVLADDSGLCVESLGGEPGVRSARYAAAPGSTGNSSTRDNNRKLLAAMQGVPDGSRGACFVCALAVAELPEARGQAPRLRFTARGECRGVILGAERGSGGFGYDPLFYLPERGLTFAELPSLEKNRFSHRGRALRELREKILQELEGEKDIRL